MGETADTIDIVCLRLDRRSCALLTPAGETVKLGVPAFRLLECLVDRRDRVVSTREILEHVWSGKTVSENNVTAAVFNLRKVLAAHCDRELITNIQGEGYRFMGEVRPEPPLEIIAPPESLVPIRWPTGRRNGLVVAALLAGLAAAIAAIWQRGSPPAPPELSIAVLPFRDNSDAGVNSALANAITDDLTTDLSYIPGSVVIARPSVEAFRDRSISPRQIGEQLHVRYLLIGSLRGEKDQYRIDSGLIDTKTGQQIWWDRFNTPATAIDDTQTTIVRRIASALDATITVWVATHHDRPNDPTAQDYFFRGRALMERQDTLAGFTAAQDLLRQAIGLQPHYADALAELGLALVLKTRIASDPTPAADLTAAREAIGQALELSQTNATALAADARLHETEGDCLQASQSAKAALNLEPNSFDAFAVLAKCAESAGRLEDAASYEFTLLRLNPESGRERPRDLLLGQIRLLQGRYPEAIDLASRALVGDPPPSPGADCMGRAEYARLILISALQLNGEPERARALYTQYAVIWPRRTVWRIAAYSPRHLASLPGFRTFLSGLADAGMPRYADEHAPDRIDAADLIGPIDDFAKTPIAWPGAMTVDTATVAASLASGRASVVLDLGQGAATIPNAAWLDRSATDAPDTVWIDQVLAGRPNPDLLQTVVVMGSGTYGQTSLRAARYLLAKGYRNIFWYRGGEEAWAAARLQSVDRRLID